MTDDPRQDVVEAALVFRRFALEHPALFSIAFHRVDPAVWPGFRPAASDALVVLVPTVRSARRPKACSEGVASRRPSTSSTHSPRASRQSSYVASG